MKTLVCQEPGTLQYVARNVPAMLPGNALIKVKRVGICGTDLHAFDGTQPFFSYPRVLGHELSGELIDFDEAPGFTKGEAVTVIPYFSCGTCIACRRGKTNCCVQLQVMGVHIDGAMCECISVPSANLVHANGLSYNQLALVEMLAIGAHGVARAAIQKNEFVLVAGAGPIGLGVMEFAKLAGANVIALDVNTQRLQISQHVFNIPHTVEAKGDVVSRLLEIAGDLPTTIIDATGNLHAIKGSFQYLAHGGKYVLVGLQKGDICFSHPNFHKKEATLMSSRNACRGDFEQVITALKFGTIKAENYITHQLAFSNVQSSFAGLTDPAMGVIKAMIHFD